MAAVVDSSISKFTIEEITTEQWKEIRTQIMRDLKFPMKEDAGRVEWGSHVHDWDTGVFEWEYRPNRDAKPESGPVDIRIRRRPFDPQQTNIEILIAKFVEALKEKKAA